MIVGKNKIVECSSLENDSFHQVEPNELDPAFVRLELMLPIYNRWKNQFGEEDHGESDLIAFIKQLKDEEISIYFTDTILEKAKKWNDEHGYGIIDLIRYAIIDGLENKRQCPLTPFDTSRDKEWIEQVYDSVRDGELSYKRHLQVYTSDDPLHISPEKDLRNLMSIFKDQTLEEQIFFYHGTTEINAQLIISRGIHLHLNRSRPGDFGFGFYTTNSLFDALRHAENRANRTDGEQRAACLIFSISKHEFNSYQIVRLSYDEKHEVAGEKMDESTINNNNIFEWCNFVYKCLNNDPPLPLIHNKDAIIGPISMNLRNITLGHKPIKRRGRPIPTQTAIISMKLVFALLDGLKGVIISGKKK
ncbi:hypothetical protein I4U23_010317 [Adineta vaga]|nr:hypothetical protein I4U23_010317 [Adineta vaga]